jgi:hypothetical protein
VSENHIDISVDLGWGKDGETGFYLYIGESF